MVMAEALCHCPKGADGGHLQKDPWMWRPPPAPAAPSLHLPPRPVWAFLSGLLSSGSHESLLPLSDFRVSWNHHSRQEAVPRIPFAEEFCRAHTVFLKLRTGIVKFYTRCCVEGTGACPALSYAWWAQREEDGSFGRRGELVCVQVGDIVGRCRGIGRTLELLWRIGWLGRLQGRRGSQVKGRKRSAREGLVPGERPAGARGRLG